MLFIHARIITLDDSNTIIEDGGVKVAGGLITAVGKTEEILSMREGDEEIVDVNGRVLMPGMICAHAHFYGMYSRGMGLHDDAPQNFIQVLERLWWRLDRALDMEAVRHSANVVLCAAIRAGTTCIFDHHASPSALKGSLDVERECIKNAGVRGSICYEVTDRNGPEECNAGIEENIRFLQSVHKIQDPMIHAMFGLHAGLTLCNETLDKCHDAVKALGFPAGYHIHVCEGGDDNAETRKIEHIPRNRHASTVKRLIEHGICGPTTIYAHCVDINENDMDLIKANSINVVHNASSNMNNAVGTCNAKMLLDKGVLVGMGTDGITMDMFQEHKFAYLIHKIMDKHPGSFSVEAFDLLFKNNAKLANKLFSQVGAPELGRIGKNCAADFIIVDYIPPTPMEGGSLPWHVMFGMSSNQVKDVICNGAFVMRDRKILTLDEEKVMREAMAHASTVWDRIPALVEADKAKAK